MNSFTTLKFTLQRPGAAPTELLVDSARALVGSGAHCEIRLPAEDAHLEHLAVEFRGAGVFAEARSLEPPPLLNGVPFTAGRVLPDSVFQIGTVRIQVVATETELQASSAPSRSDKGSPAIRVLGAIGIPLGLYVIFTTGDVEQSGPQPVQAPALFAARPASECPQSEPESATRLAIDEITLADAKRERSPFHAEDGVAAVTHYERASACFRRAGDAASAEETEGTVAALKRRLSDEFHVHQVRLDRALATKRYAQARTEVRILLSFVGTLGGEYATWLATLDRHIQVKYSGKEQEGR